MRSDSVDALITEGREAFEHGDAAASLRAFEAALAERESGELLEGVARALHLAGDYPGSLDGHERAFAAFKREDDYLGAARAARLLSWLHLNLYGDWAVSGGWLARAERLLESACEAGIERGWVGLMRATREPYGESRQRGLQAALELGRRFGDANLEFAALALFGEALVMVGRVEEGMLSFDESLAAVCVGDVKDLYVVESVFCGMFLTCERVHDVVRAEEWLRAADELIRRRALVAVGPLCRAHYGGILMAAGRWDEAEAALDEAVRIFAGGYGAARAIVLVRLADLRVRQGRLEEAAVLLEGLDQVPDAARPLAALFLARGETALSREMLERRLGASPLPAPWPIATTSPAPPPVAGPLLTLLVDVCLAGDDVDGAAEAAERLAELAAHQPSRKTTFFLGSSGRCLGEVALAQGDVDEAVRRLEAAIETLRASGSENELGLALGALGRAKRLVGNDLEATASAKKALAILDRLGTLEEPDRLRYEFVAEPV